MCGGTSLVGVGLGGEDGLSPRVRGNHPAALLPGLLRRSIPACAGEPTKRVVEPLTGTVYPRVCGGTAVRAGQGDGIRGLSPRVRGNPR